MLVYAELEPTSVKGATAQWVIRRSSAQGTISAQALLEFLAVVRRRRPEALAAAMTSVADWRDVFEVTPTTETVMTRAVELVRVHRLQVWDAVIWSAAQASGASAFFTEGMHDGLTLVGVQAVNPFTRSRDELEALLPTGP